MKQKNTIERFIELAVEGGWEHNTILKKITEEELFRILEEYSRWLEKHNYMDSDWWCEEPKAVDGFINKLKE